MESTRKLIAIWNPKSGSAPDEDDLVAALPEGTTLLETTEDDPGPGQTKEALAQGATTVVACGGDGTVRAVVEALQGADAALDLVPLGTGNLLASNLGIPSGLDGAAAVGSRDQKRIDVATVNGEAFVVMAGSGFDALMIRDADGVKKSRFGTLAYVLSGAKHLRDGLVPTTVMVDGDEVFRGRTSMVLVGNHGTMTGGLAVFPDAEPDDGVLDVAILAANDFGSWARVVWRLLRGKPQPPELVQRGRGREIAVTTTKPRVYELDGEDREAIKHLEFNIRPSALRVHYGAS